MRTLETYSKGEQWSFISLHRLSKSLPSPEVDGISAPDSAFYSSELPNDAF